MTYRSLIKIILSASILIWLNQTNAQIPTKFVTDDFQVMMRTGPSIQNKIIKVLRSGESIQVLREDAGNGHSQVQTKEGEIGYMLTRFLSDQAAARTQLNRLKQRIELLRSKPGKLSALLVDAQDENQALIAQNVALTNQLSATQDQISKIEAASGNAFEISERNQKLESEVQQLLLQLDDIRIQNQTLKDNAKSIENLTSVGVLLIGLFLGWILSRSGRSRRGSWGS